jgi:hypothetical protein
MTIYDFLKDQGSLIAGLLAFSAGVLAYCAGRAQADAVEKQNVELRRSELRRLARSILVAVRLLDGVLAGMEEDIESEITYVSRGVEVAQGNGQNVAAVLAGASRKRIRKPEIQIVWEQLGYLDPEWINNYMAMDREISKLWSAEVKNDPTINSMLNEFRKLQTVVRSLRGALETDARRTNDVLLQTQ